MPYTAMTEEVEPTVIALFGDSITLGFHEVNHPFAGGLPGANGSTSFSFVPNLFLRNLLDGEPKRTSIVVNWGVGGSDSLSGVNRIASNLSSTKATHAGKKYFVLIMYGTNDLGVGIGTSTTAFNIGLMIDAANLVQFEPIVGTLTPRSDFSVIPYNSTISSTANSKSTFVVDHYNHFIDYQPGGWKALIDVETDFQENLIRLHPNDEGYMVIAQAWFDDRLAALIEEDFIPPPPITLPWLMLILDD